MIEGGNNYTKRITMARASSMPKYMQLLKTIKEFNDLKLCATRSSLVFSLWNETIGKSVCKTWQNGPFTLLKNKGLVEWVRDAKNKQVTWHITSKGRAFLAECEKKANIYIDVAAPEYRGAPYPEFDKKKVNESKFGDGLRVKSCCLVMDGSKSHGTVSWLSQLDEYPSFAWECEIKRAFKANGLKPGSIIHCKFGSRDTGYIHEFGLKV